MTSSVRHRILAGGGLALLAGGSCWAQAVEEAPVLSAGDTAFIFVCALIVLLMTLPGLALFYAGLARVKNALSVLMQVMAIASVIYVLWAIYGYSLAFSDGGALQPYIGGVSKLFLSGLTPETLQGTIPELLFVFLMMMYAAITPAIIAGGFAERMKFSAVLAFSVVWFTINYLPMAHMGWGGGWVLEWGPQDFAGGNVVHVNAGVAALVAAWLVGARRGLHSASMAPHNMTMTMSGGSLLWVGWLGFCGGCALMANGLAVLVILNTMLGAAAGAVAWMFAEWLRRGKPSLLGIVTGAVAGLVGVTPACGFVGPMGALAVGAVAALCSLWAIEKLKPALGVDDAFDVFAVHAVSGIAGGLLTPVFALSVLGGLGLPEGRGLGDQMLVQAGSIGFSVVFCAVTSFISLKVASLLCGGLRVDEDKEVEGLDTSEHGEAGYKLSA